MQSLVIAFTVFRCLFKVLNCKLFGCFSQMSSELEKHLYMFKGYYVE